jgi:hypothetical protein
MTYYPDLSACDYFWFIDAPLAGVGWLENGRPVPTGEVPEQVFEQLWELLREPWGPALCGWHDCDLCVYRYGPSKLGTYRNTMGFKNVFVPGDAKVYARPNRRQNISVCSTFGVGFATSLPAEWARWPGVKPAVVCAKIGNKRPRFAGCCLRERRDSNPRPPA